MDLLTGQIIHFPAGTYYDQHENPLRETELNLMKLVWRVYNLCQKKPTVKKPNPYSADDMELLNSIYEYEHNLLKKNPEANDFILQQWKGKSR